MKERLLSGLEGELGRSLPSFSSMFCGDKLFGFDEFRGRTKHRLLFVHFFRWLADLSVPERRRLCLHFVES